ncbi:MAG: hypothetical protein AB3X44_17270 [Leptothrix sp. (in: b-proteobacteria)]
MADHKISLDFRGYWNEYNKGNMPELSGIYCVYGGIEDPQKKSVDIKELIYVGESDNVNRRLAQHDAIPYWRSCIKKGRGLYFSFGPVAAAERERCEAALIFQHKPPANIIYVDTFPFESTTISLASKRAPLLERNFTVHRMVVPGEASPGLMRRGWQLMRSF